MKRRVRELEHEVGSRGHDDTAITAQMPSQSTISCSTATPANAGTDKPSLIDNRLNKNGEMGEEGTVDDEPSKKALWGLYLGNGQMPQKQWFGPSSLFYYISRMTSHLAKFLEHPPAHHAIHFSPSSNLFTAEDAGGDPSDTACSNKQLEPPGVSSGVYLSAMQEEYFLGFFWQSYHCAFQILDETGFKELYKSLWTNRQTRKPSALVDIILALCIQLDAGGASRSGPGIDTKRTTRAGRCHYQRCQALIVSELESPMISTLQCHIFSVIYLCNASLQNMAHSTLAMATRTAHILGLHMEPPEQIPRPEAELRKRLWWTLFILESKSSIKLGRPWAVLLYETTCSLPADDHQLAISSGYACLAGGNVTWLTYTVQSVKLLLSARHVYVGFYNECTRILSTSRSQDLYEDLDSLECCASFLKKRMECLHSWVQNVPEALKNKRKNGGEALSNDETDISTEELFAPLWLQRQRIFLELLYHNLCIILYRPLVSFTVVHSLPATTEGVTACVAHAITMTRIIHRALDKTALLDGWHEAFQWQWNSAITLFGYFFAHPFSPQSSRVRITIDMAIQAFEVFGKHFASGIRAARVAKGLAEKADVLFQRHPPVAVSSSSQAPSNQTWPIEDYAQLQSLSGEVAGYSAFSISQGAFDGAGLQDVLAGTMDVAFSVDHSFQSMDSYLDEFTSSYISGPD